MEIWNIRRKNAYHMWKLWLKAADKVVNGSNYTPMFVVYQN